MFQLKGTCKSGQLVWWRAKVDTIRIWTLLVRKSRSIYQCRSKISLWLEDSKCQKLRFLMIFRVCMYAAMYTSKYIYIRHKFMVSHVRPDVPGMMHLCYHLVILSHFSGMLCQSLRDDKPIFQAYGVLPRNHEKITQIVLDCSYLFPREGSFAMPVLS